MRITFLGGADEVGASSLLIEISCKRLLIDAGIRPSPKARWGLHGDQLPHLDAIEAPDAILVTHAHTDHTGALELVVGRYPHCPVYATPPTIALTRVLHADARHIMQTRLDEEGELPLFDDVAVERLLSALTPIEFHARLPLGENLSSTFYPAGHIAGAAMILLDSDEGRVLISGDISISPQRTVDGCKPPTLRPDVLILESTYGGRLHAHRPTEERKLVERIAAITGAGGKVLIPAFALGRAQELIEILRAFRKAGELPSIPVWVDGMVRAVCGIYSQFPDALPLALQERGAKFFDETTRAIESVAQRNALVWENNPGIIIASSGMLAGGPSLSYARAFAGKPEHAILLTGYQDEESPGRKLQAMATRARGTLKLGKDVVDVQCQLGTYALSAHADEGQLIALTETLDPTTVFVAQGDADARARLQKALRERGRRVELPRAGQALDLRFRGERPSRSPRFAPGRYGDANRLLDLGSLWREIADPGGNYFTMMELARAWWGDDTD
ncbi:MAG: MBL fold metallo-hydrolase, partial [Chloroflexota bacterium]|nr:MBL fold metallo-hydrolase [Chloroflexota bacterium]